MRPPFICVAFIAAASLFAQQNNSIDDALIFPPSNELFLAAQHGYDAGKDWRIDLAYQPPEDYRVRHACSQVTWEIRVAGPLLLAAMEGRTARIHSQGLPDIHQMAMVFVAVGILVAAAGTLARWYYLR